MSTSGGEQDNSIEQRINWLIDQVLEGIDPIFDFIKLKSVIFSLVFDFGRKPDRTNLFYFLNINLNNPQVISQM